MTSSDVDQKSPSRRKLYVVISAGIYLALCFSMFQGILKAENGHFTFSLDDPYIHLALADQIAHGHYGINPGEPASPSSSILWPFLLAPFSKYAAQPQIALLLNMLFGLTTAILIGFTVAAWPRGPDQTSDKEEFFRRAISAALLVFTGNLVGLTFIGMEHTLEVLLAGLCAVGIITALRGNKIPFICIAAAALGPMVRYETLCLSVALALALFGQKRTRAAITLIVISVLPLLAFGVFLHHLGLPPLPSSVMVKGSMAGTDTGTLHRIFAQLIYSLTQGLSEGHRMVVSILFLTLLGLAINERDRSRRFALSGAALAAGLQVLIGPFGLFYRYEVYMVLFSTLIILYVMHERPRILLGWYVLGLFGCSIFYIQAVSETVTAAQDVYLQQYQMHRFITEFYTGNVAVNDLGVVSYRHPSSEQIIDMGGLGSLEASRQTQKSTAWMDAITKRHNVGLVMIYSSWFDHAPAGWTPLGDLCLAHTPIALGDRCVSFYATSLAPLTQTQTEFAAFAKTLPPGVSVIPPASTPSN